MFGVLRDEPAPYFKLDKIFWDNMLPRQILYHDQARIFAIDLSPSFYADCNHKHPIDLKHLFFS